MRALRGKDVNVQTTVFAEDLRIRFKTFLSTKKTVFVIVFRICVGAVLKLSYLVSSETHKGLKSPYEFLVSFNHVFFISWVKTSFDY